MQTKPNTPPIDGSLVQGVVLVDEVTHPEGTTWSGPSLRGHLLQLMLEGESQVEVDGQRFTSTPGMAAWLCENQQIRLRVSKGPLRFYSVNFLAARLSPPPFERRVWKAASAVEHAFCALLKAWRDLSVPPVVRHASVFARLLDVIVASASPATGSFPCSDLRTQTWWEIEAEIRKDLSLPIDIRRLEQIGHCSARSIERVCRLAVGVSPVQRIRQLRLSYARGLILYSELRIVEVALQAGYNCPEAFTRDYHQRFGVSPTKDRRLGPDHHTLRVSNW